MLIPCIACRKEVEETIYTCPHCGTPSPNRKMLVHCRVCGKSAGRAARRCPHCTSPNPCRKKHYREYLLLIPVLLWALYLFNVGKPGSSENLITVSTLVFCFLVWFYFQYMKDLAGLNNLLSLLSKTQKPSVFATCLQCRTLIHNKTETCPNCGESVPNDI